MDGFRAGWATPFVRSHLCVCVCVCWAAAWRRRLSSSEGVRRCWVGGRGGGGACGCLRWWVRRCGGAAGAGAAVLPAGALAQGTRAHTGRQLEVLNWQWGLGREENCSVQDAGWEQGYGAVADFVGGGSGAWLGWLWLCAMNARMTIFSVATSSMRHASSLVWGMCRGKHLRTFGRSNTASLATLWLPL